MKIVLLDTLTFGETDLGGFDAFGEVEAFETTAPEETAERIANADVIVTNKVVISDEMMAATPTLKLICVAATGTNNIDIPAAEARGIAVKNVAGYSTDSVIQHTFSMLFYLLGHSRYYDSYVKNGDWARSEVFTHVGRPFHEIKGKTWGIIGLGEIGRGVAAVAKAFGAEVRYYSTSGKNANADYEKVTLSRLLEESDVVSVHAPLNAATQGLIGHSELLIMKDGATLLNLGRGGIVDERALAAIIDAKPIYVGLDVLETEPMNAGHPLMEIEHKERLYITPHIAWTSVEARDALIAKVIDNIRTFVEQ
ncbi:D-2-hydroxyacid dehydrogenase [Sulfurimonas sp. HSL-3221]|uniref:D-2-hydroxyacid dehydrogenase n=1 Tax=Sulfurimonadaceae TaxID=2771471 RepID=UPI001E2E9323|nr:D-2-hydroxyacid dehydrogenase [Sulfurimonas sp. HSL-3221]UFS62641.1 D-2-hydroxyacid dehydrogenase [Sulfurimonas sp. HSL-3221]